MVNLKIERQIQLLFDILTKQEVLVDKPIKPESNSNYLPELFVTDDADLIRRMGYFNVVARTCLDQRYPGQSN